MKLIFIFIVITLLLGVSHLSAEVKNPDKPLKGEWDFKAERIWTVDNAGGEVLARPYHIMVADDGTIYLYDIKNWQYYIFSAEGKFLKAFGPKGEGPGEIQQFRNARLLKNRLIVVDINEIDYFTPEGIYLESIKNNWNQRKPDYFLSEKEFIYFPLLQTNDPKKEGKIYRFNLNTQESKVLAEFSIFTGGYAESEDTGTGIVVMGLSPVMVVGYGPDRFYYGVNNTYTIHVADYNGKELDRFSLDRPARKINKKIKREWFKRNPPPTSTPDDMLEKISDSLPEELSYFTRMEVHNKRLYVYEGYLNRQPTRQKVDIFSPAGNYLYQGFLQAPAGYNILSGPIPVFAIKGDNLYIVLEDEDGELILAKYKITLPGL
jgi:hypothetical protein